MIDTSYIKDNPITAVLMALLFAVSFFYIKPKLAEQHNNKTTSKDMSEWTVQDWKQDIDNHMNELDSELNTCNTSACLSSVVPSFGNVGKYNSLLRYHANFTYEQEKEIKDYYDAEYTRVTEKHLNRVNR